MMGRNIYINLPNISNPKIGFTCDGALGSDFGLGGYVPTAVIRTSKISFKEMLSHN